MKTSWWYDDSDDVYGKWERVDLVLDLIRLTVADDGSADLLFSSGQTMHFPSELEAEIWMGDEEYRTLDGLREDFLDTNRPLDPRLVTPVAATDQELLPLMSIEIPRLPHDLEGG